MSKKLLVTGGAGFIGANFVHYWLAKYPTDGVVVIDSLSYAGNYDNLLPVIALDNFRFVHANILDQHIVEEILRVEKVDTLVHFAAESHVDHSITGPDIFLQTNILGTHSLLKACKTVWLDDGERGLEHHFHHVSTDEVYGSLKAEEPAFTETTAYAPNSPYSASKAASDHLVRAYHHTYGLKTTVSNCSNNYGPYHFPEKLIPLVITNTLRDKPLPIYGDGKQIRDWLFVEDHVRGIDRVIKKGSPGECYNLGGKNEWKNIDIVNIICQQIDEYFVAENDLKQRFPQAKSAHNKNSAALITYVNDRPGHDRRYAINPAKAKAVLDFEPRESFATGIRKTLSWYLSNPQWWEKILDGSSK